MPPQGKRIPTPHLTFYQIMTTECTQIPNAIMHIGSSLTVMLIYYRQKLVVTALHKPHRTESGIICLVPIYLNIRHTKIR